MRHFALVVAYELPDDTDHFTAVAALEAMVAKIHETTPAPPANVTAYTDVSAEVIAQASAAGALLGQAERLQLQPDDVIKITMGPECDADQLADALKLVPQLFPEHPVVVLGHNTTLETGPAEAGVAT